MAITHTAHPFRLNGELSRYAWLERGAEWISGLTKLDRKYQALPRGMESHHFLTRALAELEVDYCVPEEELSRLPLGGGTIVVANHPFGGLDGMVLAHLLGGLRQDVRILANGLLARIPELHELFLGVNPFGGKDAPRQNLGAIREALRWVEHGGMLLIFPAGEVAHPDRRGIVTDPAWSPSIARLIRRAAVPVVPVHVQGRNSLLFQAAGLIHPLLRTALLPRELLNKKGQTISLRIGNMIERNKLQESNDTTLIQQLRMRTYLMGDLARPSNYRPQKEQAVLPLTSAQDPQVLQQEIAQLLPEQCLVESGEMEVWYARASQIPHLLQEIGRLRELTFRDVGEGTGNSSDIDLYDSYYLHLFVWQRERHELVGAYRLGLIDQILPHYGKKGLYTHSLFRYRRQLIANLPPAIELGRSFVQPAYQRSFSPLLLLWKGIGEFVLRHPHYRVLLGPVSISNDYHALSRQLMVAFLNEKQLLPELARQVRARRRFRGIGRRWHSNGYAHLADIEGLSELIGQIEGDGRGAPILLKQYLKMGGKLLGFNVDRHFHNAIDGLIMVDLPQTEARVLARYMGQQGVQQYLARHQHAITTDVAATAGPKSA